MSECYANSAKQFIVLFSISSSSMSIMVDGISCAASPQHGATVAAWQPLAAAAA